MYMYLYVLIWSTIIRKIIRQWNYNTNLIVVCEQTVCSVHCRYTYVCRSLIAIGREWLTHSGLQNTNNNKLPVKVRVKHFVTEQS